MQYGKKERGHYKGDKSQQGLTSTKDPVWSCKPLLFVNDY